MPSPFNQLVNAAADMGMPSVVLSDFEVYSRRDTADLIFRTALILIIIFQDEDSLLTKVDLT